eukprot:Colp12_sorted_trinity150504_noHs@31750
MQSLRGGLLEAEACGQVVEYWSTCGLLGSAASQNCYEGGKVLDSTSCLSFTSPYSQRCNIAGCQSLCRRHMRQCVAGNVEFVEEHSTVSSSESSYELSVLRRDGRTDGAINITSNERSVWGSHII